MNYKIHAQSIPNELCALAISSCTIDCQEEMPDRQAITFVEYMQQLRSAYSVVDGVAVIEASGVLGERLDDFDVYFGMTDFSDIRDMIAAANADDMVSAIVLDVNSPGGFVTGTEETAAAIMRSAKPVVAFTSTMAASAGYWIFVAAKATYASPSATLASVGVYSLFYDWSEAFAQMGIKAELFASGKFKGMGSMGVPLTDEQSAHLQEGVDELAAEFKGFVRARRGNVSDANMEGQGIRAKVAIKENMVDRIGTLEDAINEARSASAFA